MWRSVQQGFDALRGACVAPGVPFLAWSGEGGQDLELEASSTAPRPLMIESARYWDEGGLENLGNLFRVLSDTLRGTSYGAAPPAQVPRNGVYRAAQRASGRPVIAIAFYRAHWMSGNLGFVDACVRTLQEHGANVLPVFTGSLRETAATTRATQPAPISWSKRASLMGPTRVRSRRPCRISSWPAANGIAGSRQVPSATVAPSGT